MSIEKYGIAICLWKLYNFGCWDLCNTNNSVPMCSQFFAVGNRVGNGLKALWHKGLRPLMLTLFPMFPMILKKIENKANTNKLLTIMQNKHIYIGYGHIGNIGNTWEQSCYAVHMISLWAEIGNWILNDSVVLAIMVS